MWFSLINSNFFVVFIATTLSVLQKLLYIYPSYLPHLLSLELFKLSEMMCFGLKSSVLSVK